MGYYTELETLNLDELEQRFERDGNYDDYYEEVAEQIVAQGEPGLAYLKKIVDEARVDEPQMRAAVWVLSLQGDSAWYHEKLGTLLQDTRERVVAAAVDGLASINARDLAEAVLRLQTHPSPYVRGSVLRYMRKLFPEEAPSLLIAALKDAHPIVRENAIDELDELDYYEALPEIRPLLRNQPDSVHQAALSAVKNFTELQKRASRPASETEGGGKQQSGDAGSSDT